MVIFAIILDNTVGDVLFGNNEDKMETLNDYGVKFLDQDGGDHEVSYLFEGSEGVFKKAKKLFERSRTAKVELLKVPGFI